MVRICESFHWLEQQLREKSSTLCIYFLTSRYYQQFQIILYNIHRRTLTCLHPLKGLQPIIRYLKSADTGAECAPASKTHATHFIFPRIDLMLGSNTLTKQVK